MAHCAWSHSVRRLRHTTVGQSTEESERWIGDGPTSTSAPVLRICWTLMDEHSGKLSTPP